MAKHTPEPWGLVGEPNGYTVWNVVDDGVNPGCVGRILARVCGAAVTVEEEEANARLIAAAPDLLAALKELVYCDDNRVTHPVYAAAMEQARVVIARAEGDTP